MWLFRSEERTLPTQTGHSVVASIVIDELGSAHGLRKGFELETGAEKKTKPETS